MVNNDNTINDNLISAEHYEGTYDSMSHSAPICVLALGSSEEAL